MAKWMYMVAVAAAAGAVLCGCGRVKEAKERAEVERDRAAAAAAVDPGHMRLERIGGGGWLDTSELGGAWLLLAYRSDDGACRAAMAGEWSELAREAEGVGGRVVGVYADWTAGDAEGRDEAALEAARQAAYPVCAAGRAELDALELLGTAAVSPTAYLFGADGRSIRVTGGFARPEHHLADLAAVAAGKAPPVHPAQGVLPEENDP